MAKSSVEFWLKDWDNVYLQLPVNPSEVEIESPFNINVVNIAALGEVSYSGERGLKRISFDSFFPRDYNPSYCEYQDFMTPQQWIDQIETWRDTRKNIRLIVAGTTLSIPVYVTDFSYSLERAGAPGDIYYSISFVEAKTARTTLLIASSNSDVKSTQSTRQSSSVNKPKQYTVVKGDSLWLIAKRYYGKGEQWRRIYDANKKVVGKNPDLIYPGQKLVIP